MNNGKKAKSAKNPSMPEFGLEELAEFNQKSISSAGPRYFLNCVPEFPDMQIASFDEAIAGLIGGDDFRVLVEDIRKKIDTKWVYEYKDELPKPKDILRALDKLAVSTPGEGEEAIVKIRQLVECELGKVYALREKMRKEREDRREREEKQSLQGGYYLSAEQNVISYEMALGEALDFMPEQDRSPITGEPANMRPNACGLHQNGSLILHSEWGMGKTHSLCCLAKRQMARDLPALLVLTKDLNLVPSSSPGDSIAQHTKLADEFDGLLQRLDALGREYKSRALLLVDGINEQNPDRLWERELAKMLKQVRRFPFVGLVVSFRDPFPHVLPQSDWLETPCLSHEGFKEIPIEAQEAFFKYYDVPLPEIPPMAEEFTRPLTLKIIAEIFKELPKKEQRKGFDGIASGQKGITYILEHYIKNRAHNVAKNYSGVSKNDIWSLLDEIMAPYMAKNLVEEMPAAILLEAMRDRFAIDIWKGKRMLRAMKSEGIILMSRGFPWGWRRSTRGNVSHEKQRKRMLVQMPYQRLGDHLIARELLKYLKADSASTVRRSFYKNTPLGRVFMLDGRRNVFRPTGHYTESGLSEALILEFPERIKNTPGISTEERELLFYLPRWKEKYNAYRDPFLSGLSWREKSTFSNQTINLIGSYLRNWEDEVVRSPVYHSTHGLIDALLSLACRRDSPLPARLFYKWIKSMNMADRDVLWGAAIWQIQALSWRSHLFTWLLALENNGFKNMSASVARNYVVLLSLFLGITDRPLRDQATKFLVAIGERFPSALFSHALDTLNFNDIYYPERMLAACYGVAMSRWSVPGAKEFHREFPGFARAIVRNIFMPRGKLLTHHALVRDYALGITAIARRLGVKFNKKQEVHMSPPFPAVPSSFPSAVEIHEADLSDVDSALHMDFKNYTIGHLIPERRSYDDSNKDYVEILLKIKWRMKNLGYTSNTFKERDDWISRRPIPYQSIYGKLDRYGKKYSWIAYYEMYGWLHAQGRKMFEWRDPKRPAEGIIDPSFPVPSQGWDLTLKSLPMHGDNLQWIAHAPSHDYSYILETNAPGNDWVMLEGLTTHKNKDKSRELFYFLRGLLVRDSDIIQLQKALSKNDYPMGDIGLDEDVYIFAGEIPWSISFTQTQDGAEEKRYLDAVPVETVAFTYAWEPHHSKQNQFSGVLFPVSDICTKLQLSRRGRSVDLFDEHGALASVYQADNGKLGQDVERPLDEFEFLHIRKDLLDRYLRITGKRLVWIIWEERRLLSKDILAPDPPEIEAAMRKSLNINNRLLVYPLNPR